MSREVIQKNFSSSFLFLSFKSELLAIFAVQYNQPHVHLTADNYAKLVIYPATIVLNVEKHRYMINICMTHMQWKWKPHVPSRSAFFSTANYRSSTEKRLKVTSRSRHEGSVRSDIDRMSRSNQVYSRVIDPNGLNITKFTDCRMQGIQQQFYKWY